MKKMFVLGAAVATAMTCSNVQAAEMAAGGHMGTLGAGLSLTTNIRPDINGRIGFNTFNFDESGDEDDVTYNIDLNWRSVTALLDWHPFSGGFRTTAGLMLNNNEVEMQAQLSGQVTIGNITYQASDLGSLTGLVDFDSVAPYLGIGWGNAVSADKKWGFTADLGVVFQGSPNIDLNATLGSTAAANGVTQAQLDAEVAREEANLTDDLDDFDVYPVIAFGASYRFK